MYKKIIFAGGCFWGLEDLIRTQPGVISTEVGYTGGKNDNPTYENHPGHAEAVEVVNMILKNIIQETAGFFLPSP